MIKNERNTKMDYENLINEDKIELTFEKIRDFKYGENYQQQAALYKFENMADYTVLNDKELSFNDIGDITQAVNIVSEFYDMNCCAIIKHSKPCSCALGTSLYEAYTKAFDCDPISAFSSVAGFSKKVDVETAKLLNSTPIKVVIAPDYDEKSIKIFEKNNEIKLVKLNTSLKDYKLIKNNEISVSPFGILVQEQNKSELSKNSFKVVTKTKPTKEQIEDAIFAWKIAKYCKTDSVVIAKDFKSHAISQGFTNTLSAIEQALDFACDNSKDAVLASDTCFQTVDCINSASQGRIGLIIQPGNSACDKKIIEQCDKYNIVMITTGITNHLK